MKCHGLDGTGSPARGLFPAIPNFTVASWQARRSAAQLLVSIFDGKDKDMPSFRGKIPEDQARGLVTHVRTFAPTTEKPGPKKQQEAGTPRALEEEFHRLEEHMAELRRQYRELAKSTAKNKPSRPSEAAPPSSLPEPVEPAPQSGPVKPSPQDGAAAPVDRKFFRLYCVIGPLPPCSRPLPNRVADGGRRGGGAGGHRTACRRCRVAPMRLIWRPHRGHRQRPRLVPGGLSPLLSQPLCT